MYKFYNSQRSVGFFSLPEYYNDKIRVSLAFLQSDPIDVSKILVSDE